MTELSLRLVKINNENYFPIGEIDHIYSDDGKTYKILLKTEGSHIFATRKEVEAIVKEINDLIDESRNRFKL